MMILNPFLYADFLGYINTARDKSKYYSIYNDTIFYQAFTNTHNTVSSKEKLFLKTKGCQKNSDYLHVSAGLIYTTEMFYVVKSGADSYNMHPKFIRLENKIAKRINKNFNVKVTSNVLKDCIYEFTEVEKIDSMVNFSRNYHYINSKNLNYEIEEVLHILNQPE